jgi:hypothetical protein
MRRARILPVALALAGALIATAGLPANAQEATPGVVDLSPNYEMCNQAPRTLEEIQATAGTPAPAGSGEATAAALDQNQQVVELPVGEEPPKEAVDGVVATIVQNIACRNGGDLLAALGGVTDTYLQSQVAAGFLDEDLLTVLAATPTALPEEQQLQLLDTREFALYPDGRVGVLVYYRTPAEPESGVDGLQIELWIFQESDGRWLLDEVIANLEQQLQDVATPAAG